MGNALFVNWSDTQKGLYYLQEGSSIAVSLAFGTALTHQCVAEWMIKGRMESGQERPKAPAFLIPLFMFWAMWTVIFTPMKLGEASRAIYIATNVLAFGGFFVNLAFTFAWQYVADRVTSNGNDDVENGSSNTSPLLNYTPKPIRVTPLLDYTDDVGPSQDVESPIVATAAETPPNPRATVDYINNIKIFLTNIVILHHCFSSGQGITIQDMIDTSSPTWGNIILGGVFTPVNQAYFMNLFFFYSGYFVPKSFDKKGIHEFLFDRVKRLGIPFVVYTFFLGTTVEYGFRALLFPTKFSFPSGINNWGPTWFLNQLMIFSIVYAFACGKNWSPAIACPSILGFFVIGLLVGLFTGILILFVDPGDEFFAVPAFWANYLSYVVYFFAGAVAQRNDWMSSIKNEKSRGIIYAWAVLSTALYCTLIIIFRDKVTAWPDLLLVQGVLCKGVLCMGLCLAVTVFFMDHANKKFKYLTPFFSKAMYTAYIIQYAFPMIVGAKCVVLIFEATGNIVYYDGSPYISNDNLIFPGWLILATITLAITWPLAYVIRSIPGFSQVL